MRFGRFEYPAALQCSLLLCYVSFTETLNAGVSLTLFELCYCPSDEIMFHNFCRKVTWKQKKMHMQRKLSSKQQKSKLNVIHGCTNVSRLNGNFNSSCWHLYHEELNTPVGLVYAMLMYLISLFYVHISLTGNSKVFSSYTCIHNLKSMYDCAFSFSFSGTGKHR